MSYVAIDLAHVELIYGAVLSCKPENILELGYGSGLVTRSLCRAIKYNQLGKLTCVDNWHDWGGQMPAEINALTGVTVVTSSEGEFVRTAVTNSYDFLVSDADHNNSGTWFHEHCRIVQNGGFMFFHDTNQKVNYPTLFEIEEKANRLGMPCYHFKKSSRKDERCERGFLFVINKRPL